MMRGARRAAARRPLAPRRPLCTALPPAWVKLATKEIGGADPAEKLTVNTPEGIALKPLYTASDVASSASTTSEELPGVAPYTRGPYATMYTHRP